MNPIGPPTFAPGSLGALSDVSDDLKRFESIELVTELLRRYSGCGLEVTNPHVFGQLAHALVLRTDVHGNRFSRERLVNQCRTMRTLDFDPHRKTVVELGSGGLNPFARLMVFYLFGARQCIAVDLEGIRDFEGAAVAMWQTAQWILASPQSFSLPGWDRDRMRILADAEVADFERLRHGDLTAAFDVGFQFIRCNADFIPLHNCAVDLVISTSFLEHVPSANRTVEEIARITRGGGQGFHAIDGVDHRHYRGAAGMLDFLEIETDDALVFGCNRVRPLQFPEIFDAAGFDVLRIHELAPVDHTERPSTLASRFAGLDAKTLRFARAHLTLRRRNT